MDNEPHYRPNAFELDIAASECCFLRVSIDGDGDPLVSTSGNSSLFFTGDEAASLPQMLRIAADLLDAASLYKVTT